jgi:hypothetical protein
MSKGMHMSDLSSNTIFFKGKPRDPIGSAHALDYIGDLNLSEMPGNLGILRFNARITESHSGNTIAIFRLYFFPKGVEGKPRLSESIKFLRGDLTSEQHTFAFNLGNLEDLPEEVSVFAYVSRENPVSFEIYSAELLGQHHHIRISRNQADGLIRSSVHSLDLQPTWSQTGRRLEVSWLDNTFFAEMPEGFKLEKVSPERLEAADILLFDAIGQNVFNTPRKLVSKDLRMASRIDGAEPDGSGKIMLSFSTGEDSTAALALLPSKRTIPFYSKRTYSEYRRADGIVIHLGDREAEQRSLKMLSSVVEVPTSFEKIGISVGLRHGYVEGFGYGAIGLLLCDHFGAEMVAFGSVMEQVYLKSGNNFTDIRGYESSRYNRYRDLFAWAKTGFVLPTGFLSEILTNKICQLSIDQYKAVPCPDTDPDGNPCGTCFKCFRKLRLEGKIAPVPAPNVVTLLEKRPLKSATSVVLAAQISGCQDYSLDEYTDLDLKKFNRYFATGLHDLVPPILAKELAERLSEFDIEPMTNEEEEWVRDIAQIFDPDNYDVRKARP